MTRVAVKPGKAGYIARRRNGVTRHHRFVFYGLILAPILLTLIAGESLGMWPYMFFSPINLIPVSVTVALGLRATKKRMRQIENSGQTA